MNETKLNIRSFANIIIGSLIILHLLSPYVAAEDGFLENFSDSVLSSKWKVWNWNGKPWTYHIPSDYSMIDNPGHLRYYLGAMAMGGQQPSLSHYWYYPSLQLFRIFEGACWQIDMKVTYFLPYSNAKSFSFSIGFGKQFEPAAKIRIQKKIDQIDMGNQPVHFTIIINDNGQETRHHIFPMVDLRYVELMTYYFRIVRLESQFLLLWSLDGNYFETIMKYKIYGLDNDVEQYFKIEGVSWFTPTGAYAEFDYVNVVPIPAEIILNNIDKNFIDYCGEEKFISNLLYPFDPII